MTKDTELNVAAKIHGKTVVSPETSSQIPMQSNDPIPPNPSDQEILEWVRSRRPEEVRKAVEALQANTQLIREIRGRCRTWLQDREMLHPDQSNYRPDAESDALYYIYVNAFSFDTLPRTLLERGEGFDPSRGSLKGWLKKQAYFQFRDWIKKHAFQPQDYRGRDADEIASSAQGNPRSADEDAQALRVQRKMEICRDLFSTLPDTERACMLIQYIDDTNDTVLRAEDLQCIHSVKETGQSNPKVETPEAVLLELRRELSALWANAADRAASRLKDDEASDKSGPQAVAARKAENERDRLFGQLRIETKTLEYYRGQLLAYGCSDALLESLADDAKRMTLQQIKSEYQGRPKLEGKFAEFSLRVERTIRRLNDARAAVQNVRPLHNPEARDIALFLGKSPNAVSSALSRAHKTIRERNGSAMNSEEFGDVAARQDDDLS